MSVSFEDALEAAVERVVKRELAGLREALEALSRRLPSRFVSVAEAARELGVCAATVRRQAELGELPSRRVGARVLIDMSSMASGEEASR